MTMKPGDFRFISLYIARELRKNKYFGVITTSLLRYKYNIPIIRDKTRYCMNKKRVSRENIVLEYRVQEYLKNISLWTHFYSLLRIWQRV